MHIKVCGLNDERNILEVASLSPDFMGFIFYDQSPRYAGNLQKKIYKGISPEILKTGVFVNESIEKIIAIVNDFEFDCIQLHGNEDPYFCEELKFFMPAIQLIKAVSVGSAEDVLLADIYDDVCDFILFDTKTENFGGSGIKFNHFILSYYSGNIPFFLSGGMGPDDIEYLKKMEMEYENMHAVDLNSKFEISPGIKNISLLKNSILSLKNTQKI